MWMNYCEWIIVKKCHKQGSQQLFFILPDIENEQPNRKIAGARGGEGSQAILLKNRVLNSFCDTLLPTNFDTLGGLLADDYFNATV